MLHELPEIGLLPFFYSYFPIMAYPENLELYFSVFLIVAFYLGVCAKMLRTGDRGRAMIFVPNGSERDLGVEWMGASKANVFHFLK